MIGNWSTHRGLSLCPALCMLEAFASAVFSLTVSCFLLLCLLSFTWLLLSQSLGDNAPLWPHSWLLFTCPCLLIASFTIYYLRLLRENSICLICLFTPDRTMVRRPAPRLAAVGSSARFWSNSWKDGHVWHPRPPRQPQQQGCIQDNYLRKGLSITGFLFGKFYSVNSLSPFVFQSI